MNSGAHGDQKRVPDVLGLKLQVVVNHLTWVLGIKLEFPWRKQCALLATEPSLLPPHGFLKRF